MDQNTAKNKHEHSAAEIKLACQIGASLFGMLKAVHLYPRGHQMLSQVVQKFYTTLQEVINHKQIAVFRIYENNLYVLDIHLDNQKLPGIDDFIEEMQKRYIRQVIFNSTTNLTDIDLLVEILNIETDQISSLGGASNILTQKGSKGIRIVEYYSSKHSTLDQERLLSLTNSIIFRYFTQDEITSLDIEQTHFLYELLQESQLVCELIKIAAQFIIRKHDSELSENQLFLKILGKIKAAITTLELSEADEIQTILKDLVSAFGNQVLFDLIFEDPDAEILQYTKAANYLLEQMDINQTAKLFVKKIAESDQSSSIIAHTKHVLSRVFIDRSAFLNFLPAFKQTLQADLEHSDKTSSILNDICSAFAPGFSLEDDVELALGTITANEKTDIIDGLNVLKTVQFEKDALKKYIHEYSDIPAHLEILHALLSEKQETAVFNDLLDKSLQLTKTILQGADLDQSAQALHFFVSLINDTSAISIERKMAIAESLENFPQVLIEKFTLEMIEGFSETKVKLCLNDLFVLFSHRLIALLLRLYTQKGDLSKDIVIKQTILDHHNPNALNMNIDLCKEPTNSILRLLELIQLIKDDSALPLVWPILFHENIILAHRTLKLIADYKSPAGLNMLIQALKHPHIALRIVCIEYLGAFRYKEVRSIIALIARGQDAMCADEILNTDIRIAALKSLRALDKQLAITVLKEIRKKRRLLIFPAELKALRVFARIQLRELQNK
ncbi:MAG: HEAT repeat domain-containing protein [Candidatus Omnitrophica bacterium]|nr:HEAT repeat domain-containing protein [Candidatus Omnitrophota bacterium]